ncbi:hypothetical protein EON62_02750 [archaeon]|nr:MAG: hypothetical protein EON62_02750 [archaeon]
MSRLVKYVGDITASRDWVAYALQAEKNFRSDRINVTVDAPETGEETHVRALAREHTHEHTYSYGTV